MKYMSSNRHIRITEMISLTVIFIFSFLFFSCLDLDSMTIILNLNKYDFHEGHARLIFKNIHSNEPDSKKNKDEISDFFENYQKDAGNILQTIPLYSNRVELKNKNELSTDAVLEGDFKNILSVLSGFLSESEFQFSGNRKRLSVYWKNPLTENDNLNLEIHYTGKIISHNSKKFDNKTKTMKWNLGKNGDKEIKFILENI